MTEEKNSDSSKPAEASTPSTPAATDAAAKPAKKPAAKSGKEGAGAKSAAAKPAAEAATATAVAAPANNLAGSPLDPNEFEKPKIVKAKGAKNITTGLVHILATFNNTLITISDMTGNVLSWSSAGKIGQRGSRKGTAFAAQLAARDAGVKAMGHGLKEAHVRVEGPGNGRESAIRALQAIGLEVLSITDVTPLPHNGCRPRKPRRV